jgi:hypothetical protein
MFCGKSGWYNLQRSGNNRKGACLFIAAGDRTKSLSISGEKARQVGFILNCLFPAKLVDVADGTRPRSLHDEKESGGRGGYFLPEGSTAKILHPRGSRESACGTPG